MPDDPEATRRRLAKAEARLAADPANQELRRQVFRLENALNCLEWLADMRRIAARAELVFGTWVRRN